MTVSTTTTLTYEWFDGIRASPLLKIDSTHSDTYTSKSVNYLMSESTTGLQEQPALTFDCTISPNPMGTSAVLRMNQNLEDASLLIWSADGRPVRQMYHLYGQTVLLSREGLSDGAYLVRITQANSSRIFTTKLVITH
jgi:hypothetical protein